MLPFVLTTQCTPARLQGSQLSSGSPDVSSTEMCLPRGIHSLSLEHFTWSVSWSQRPYIAASGTRLSIMVVFLPV